MKNRIDTMFASLANKNEAALIPFVTTGYPDIKFTEELVRAMTAQGADLIELGMPFSDPVADGPTIEAASHFALSKNNISPPDILHLVERLRQDIDIPIVLMGYYNQFLCYGLERFAADAADAGVDGTIIPDLPVDEARQWLTAAKSNEIHNIFLVAPNTPEKRLARIARETRGFLYYVSVMGITGARNELPAELVHGLDRTGAICRRPVAVGFGISRPEQVAMLSGHCNGIIVGSAIVKLIEKGAEPHEIGEFVKGLKQAVLSQSL